MVPQGFLASGVEPGRLTEIPVEHPEEFIIHAYTDDDYDFHHRALYMDIDNDGWLDVVTVWSSFRVSPFQLPQGALLWYKNPGKDLDKDTEWIETILYAGTVGSGPDWCTTCEYQT
jgi:hypothetical protein